MPLDNQDFRTSVRIFIENFADDFSLTIYEISLLKVIADYCDMPLGYCCLSPSKLEKFSRMKDNQRRKSINILIDLNLIFRSYLKGKPVYRIGDVILGMKNENDQ